MVINLFLKKLFNKGDKFECVPQYPDKISPPFRIRALRDIGHDIKKGDWGGLISWKHAVSQNGNCWVYPESEIMDRASIEGNAKLQGKSLMTDYSYAGGNVTIFDTEIRDHAQVFTICDRHSLRVGECLFLNSAQIQGDGDVSNKTVKDDNIIKVSRYSEGLENKVFVTYTHICN